MVSEVNSSNVDVSEYSELKSNDSLTAARNQNIFDDGVKFHGLLGGYERSIITANQSNASILWKAFIQVPTRLTEADASNIPRPEFYGRIALKPGDAKPLERTVREYYRLLPTTFEVDLEKRPRAPSRNSKYSASGRTLFTSVTRGRKVHRFLKTIPTGILQFPALNRSPQFEEFIRSHLHGPRIEMRRSNSARDYDDDIEQSFKSSVKSEVKHRGQSMKKRRRSSTSLTLEARESERRRNSLMNASISKIEAEYPISGHTNGIRRLKDSLRSLRDAHVRTCYSDVAEGGMVFLHTEDAGDQSESEFQICRRPSKTTINRLMAKSQRIVLPNILRPRVIDLDAMYEGPDILSAKVRDFDLNLPLHKESATDIRHMYKITILKDNVLRDLMTSKRLDMLPKSLRDLVRMGALYRTTVPADKGPGEVDAINRQTIFCETKEIVAETSIADAEYLWIEAKVFISGMFTHWLTKIQPDSKFGSMSVQEVEQYVRRLGKILRAHISIPTSESRVDLGTLLASCVIFKQHLSTLWTRLNDWLDSLLSCLFSRERTVREEICYLLAYVFTEPTLVEGLRHYQTIDIGYDTAVTVIHAMEISHMNFIHLYCLMSLMIEGCPMFTMLRGIMDAGPASGSPLVNHLWPRWLYYALKYWHSKQFLRDRLMLKMLNESIERAHVKGISRKHAKIAQIQLSRRFKVLTKPTTIWLDEWKKFKL